VSEMPLSFYARKVKRVLDIVGSFLLLVLTSPILAVCVVAIAADDGLPVFYNHPRVGKDGRPFSVRKFRTMTVGTDLKFNDYPTLAVVTRVGQVLRRLSLDEFPQLINILCGEMSLVGPRPAIPSQVERYNTEQRGRLAVRPGLTGLAQIQYRHNAPWSRRITTDLEYVRDLSFKLDLLIMIRTIPTVLSGEGQTAMSGQGLMGGTQAEIDDLGGDEATTDRAK
jgi:lipopolysaccharide/colanic/teichoic acid biosynthesis glycosyltransferase